MARIDRIASEEELVAAATALEAEAARRYRYLAAWWEAQGHRQLTALFDRLAAMEAEHVIAVRSRSRSRSRSRDAGFNVAHEPHPRPSGRDEDAWRSALLTPRGALSLAIDEEVKAAAFYVAVAAEAGTPGLRQLAEEFAREERVHAALLRRFRRIEFRAARARPRQPEGRGAARMPHSASCDSANGGTPPFREE